MTGEGYLIHALLEAFVGCLMDLLAGLLISSTDPNICAL